MANYAPRSPDLSGAGYAPPSPDLSAHAGAGYAPRSPNLSALATPAHHVPQAIPYPHPHPHPGYATPAQLQPQAQLQQPHAQPQLQHFPQHYPPYVQQNTYLNVPGAVPMPMPMPMSMMPAPNNPYPEPQMPAPQAQAQTPAAKPRARKASSADDLAYSPNPPSSASKPPAPGRGRRKKQKIEEEDPDDGGKPAPGILENIEVKTRFPVARIKRIMQHDEEVGKVSQVTPTAVSKALELFMISIVLKSAAQARDKSSKKVTVSHMKQVIANEPEFDFLTSVCDKYQDTAASSKAGKKAKKEETATEGEED